ncbi:MAG: hypothetical protein QM804_17930 [Propionicimonas sp.]
MAWLLLGMWASLTVAASLVSLLLGEGRYLAGIGMVQFAVLLIWIAEYPDRRFLFNIPAWAFGLVLVGLEVLQSVAARDFGGLLSLALGMLLIAVAARRAGLLAGYRWIPGGRSRPKARQPSRPRRPPSRPIGGRPSSPPAPSRIGNGWINCSTRSTIRGSAVSPTRSARNCCDYGNGCAGAETLP